MPNYWSNKGVRGASDVDGSVAPADNDHFVYNATTGLWAPRSFARGQVVMTTAAQYTSTGPGTYDSWVQSGMAFTAASLNKFTHTAGVLTYTGVGETMPISIDMSIIALATLHVTYGISINDANPAAGYTSYYSVQASNSRASSCVRLITLATGNTIRVKIEASASNGVAPRIGTAMTIG